MDVIGRILGKSILKDKNSYNKKYEWYISDEYKKKLLEEGNKIDLSSIPSLNDKVHAKLRDGREVRVGVCSNCKREFLTTYKIDKNFICHRCKNPFLPMGD